MIGDMGQMLCEKWQTIWYENDKWLKMWYECKMINDMKWLIIMKCMIRIINEWWNDKDNDMKWNVMKWCRKGNKMIMIKTV